MATRNFWVGSDAWPRTLLWQSSQDGREVALDAFELNEETSAAPGDTILPSSILSAEAFGTAVLSQHIAASGIPSEEAFGTASVVLGRTIAASGIPSEEAFGTASVVLGRTMVPTGILSEEAFGTAFVFLGNISLEGFGIASTEAFGAPSVAIGPGPVLPTGIPSEEAFGSHVVGDASALILVYGIHSAEEFGIPFLTGGDPSDLLPPQDLEPLPNYAREPFVLERWREKLAIRVREKNQIHSRQLQLDTVDIGDFGNRRHNSLSDIQGGVETERYHWSVQQLLDNDVRAWISIDT